MAKRLITHVDGCIFETEGICVCQPTKGKPDPTDILEVAYVLSIAPRDRFGRLQLYDQPSRAARNRLQEYACALDVGGARDTWDQLGKVCLALLKKGKKK